MQRCGWSSLILCGILTVTAPAQSVEELSSRLESVVDRLDRMTEENQKLREQNAELVASVEELRSDRLDQELERSVNALVDTLGQEGVTVLSPASPISFSGEFRFRAAGSAGDNNEALATAFVFNEENDGWWVDALVRLGILYEFARDVSAFVELQGHWAWGDGAATSGIPSTTAGTAPGPGVSNPQPGTLLSFNEPTTTVRIFQAWLQVRDVFGVDGLSARIGRQEVRLGNQFQFGNAEWYNGFSFDALRADFRREAFQLTGMLAKLGSIDGDFNQQPSYLFAHDDDELVTLYGSLQVIENHDIDVYWVYINGHGPTFFGSGNTGGPLLQAITASGFDNHYHTLGARIGGLFPDVADGLDWNVEGAFQVGADGGPGGREDDGFTVEAQVGLTVWDVRRLRVFARFLFASQDYVPLYPSRHAHGVATTRYDRQGFRARYGLSDLLIPMGNVWTGQLGLHVDPAEAFTIGTTVLWGTSDVRPGFAGEDNYGWELDLWADYRYSDHLVLSLGLAFILPDEAAVLLDDEFQFYGYFQARLLF